MNIDPSYKGKSLGVKLIKVLKNIGELNYCYKIVLDCMDHNIAFYELVKINTINILEWFQIERKVHVLV